MYRHPQYPFMSREDNSVYSKFVKKSALFSTDLLDALNEMHKKKMSLREEDELLRKIYELKYLLKTAHKAATAHKHTREEINEFANFVCKEKES